LSIREGPAGGDLTKAEEEGEINSDNEMLLVEAAEEKKDDEDGDKEQAGNLDGDVRMR
jgi:hypothetical protein